MLDAPADLPDGDYEVGFGEQRVPMVKRRGLWLTNLGDASAGGSGRAS